MRLAPRSQRRSGYWTVHQALLVITACLPLLVSAHAATPRTLVAKIERVSDGDTPMALQREQ